MVVFTLEWKAELENVDSISGTPDMMFCVKLRCMSCSEVSDDVWIDPSEKSEMRGGRSTANLVMKCPFCKRESSVDSLGLVGEYSGGDFAPLAKFECRGFSPVEWKPTEGIIAMVGSNKYEVDLSEGEWCDYDEDSSESIGIYTVESRFV